jgi:hypothetical protein
MYLAHWRCEEPVVVFESDDWGLMRKPASALVRRFGEPSEWADEELESPEDLEELYRLLGKHRDEHSRPACFTANFVVANPDFDSIVNSQFTRYFEIPISAESLLKSKWLEGMERKVLFPQYHARYHFNLYRWLKDLQDNVLGARELCTNHCHGGLALIKNQNWKYHSEYIDWQTGEQSPDLLKILSSSINIFREVFRIAPRSTMPPHYIFTPSLCSAWKQVGIHYIQGANYRIIRGSGGCRRYMSHAMGERSPEGQNYLVRRIKFEPRPQRLGQGFKEAIKQVIHNFDSKIPAVIDTHRINYTGTNRDKSLRQLDDLLAAMRPYKPKFLNTVELGEAIESGGEYRDSWTGHVMKLTPLDLAWRSCMRRGLDYLHSHQMNTHDY